MMSSVALRYGADAAGGPSANAIGPTKEQLRLLCGAVIFFEEASLVVGPREALRGSANPRRPFATLR